jgi:uncharacterized protein
MELDETASREAQACQPDHQGLPSDDPEPEAFDPAGGRPVTTLALREFHMFRAASRDFLYLVPSAAIFGLDEVTAAVVHAVSEESRSENAIVGALADRFPAADVRTAIGELRQVRAVGCELPLDTAPARVLPSMPFPLNTLVLNLTNQCNLACTYCYEYGEDKIVDVHRAAKPKCMSEDTAREAVDFLLNESGASRVVHLTFFGGETLLNMPVLKATIAYARRAAAQSGKTIDFSLTTNATLLRPDIIAFLADNQVGVTISIDGPRELQNKFRVFADGTGSYDIVAPKIKELLHRHRSRPIGARVTLTSDARDIALIYRHLTGEFGFWEVGFALVTASPNQHHAIDERGFDGVLDQFRALAQEYLDHAVANRHHGFSNVRETLEEIHKGASKAYPCGAGIGLLGVATDGDVALCHRFAGSDSHKLGTVRDGIDRAAQVAFFEGHHIDDKTDCSRCWARPLCSGGCYHEAQVRYGSTTRPNLHYCEWIRGWTDACLQIYGELSERNPMFLARFDGEEVRARTVV